MASKRLIGFIGLGNMGSNMARNLMKKDYALVVYDVHPEAMVALQEAGAVASRSPAEVADQTDCIITMLPASPQVKEVYLGEKGILELAKPGTRLIDSSTIDPTVSIEVETNCQRKNAIFLDAPVSGGVPAAKSATLTFMVGGPEKDFQVIQPLLSCMGQKAIYCGKVGSGEAAKICNNMLLAISMIGTAETMNLGMRLGLDAKLLADIINSSSGRCWSSHVYNPVPGVVQGSPACGNYEGGFSTALMTKDLGLAQNAATTTASPTPLGALSYQLYQIMNQKGFSNKDFSFIYRYLQETANK